MMKVMALDIGNVWVGSAISDLLGITCKPYQTVKLELIDGFLEVVFKKESIGTVVVGHPITVGGNSSIQTKQIEEVFQKLKKQFECVGDLHIKWILWDERFSTKRALGILSQSKKHDRKANSIKEHSLAAAFILQSYLDGKALHEK